MLDDVIGHVLFSIHAPVKGATFYGIGITVQFFLFSIHAPVKGAT